jgi:hypothetical protein
MALSANTARAAARAIRQGHGSSHDDGDACLELVSRLEREAEAAAFAREAISIIEADQDEMARAMAEAEALVRADQESTTPQDLRDLAERAVRMAAGVREHVWAGRVLDAWAAADWLGDLAQEVKDRLPVSSQDIVAAIEGDHPAAAKVARAVIRSGAVPPGVTEEAVRDALVAGQEHGVQPLQGPRERWHLPPDQEAGQ